MRKVFIFNRPKIIMSKIIMYVLIRIHCAQSFIYALQSRC